MLLSSASRLVTYAIPALWLSTRSNFELKQFWYLGAVTVFLQAVASVWLLQREFQRGLASRARAQSGALVDIAALSQHGA